MNGFLALFDLIGELGRRRYRFADDYFARLQLNHTEARLLTLLSQSGGKAGQDALASQLFIDRSNVGRALKSLEARNLIVRRKDEVDKRAFVVEMQEGGRQLAAQIADLKREMVRSFFGALKEEEAGLIVSVLERALEEDAGA